MALLQKGTIFAVATEDTIGAGKATAWANSDVVGVNEDSSLTPTTESIERNVLNGTFYMCPSVTGNETVSGSLNVELGVQAATAGEAGKLKGHNLFLAGMGIYVKKGADVNTVAKTIIKKADPVANPTGYDLYALAKPSDPRTTLAVRELIGGSGDNVLDYKGLVVDSIALNLATGQIATASFSLSGIKYDTATGQTVLVNSGCGANPFVVKSAKFSVDDVELQAMDVTLNIANTNTDRMAISSTGISDKVTTAKAVDISYTLDMVDTSAYAKLKANATAEIFIELTNGVEKIFIYLPKVNYKEVAKNNDGGVITLQISSSAYPDALGEPIYIASKK